MTTRLLEELSDLEKLGLIEMSYSRIDTFLNCNAKYFHTYIQKAPQQGGNKFSLLGNVIHSVLENTLETDKVIDPNDLQAFLDMYDEQLKAWDTQGDIIPMDMIDAGIEMIQEFVDRHSGSSFPIVEKEKEFKIVVGTAFIRGFIDRVDLSGDLVTFVDYKSGRKEETFKGIKDNIQLGIYALALNKMYPGKRLYGELYYLRSGRQKGHLFTEDDLLKIEPKIVSLVNDIIQTQNFKPTANARACNWCDHAKSGTCKVGAKRI